MKCILRVTVSAALMLCAISAQAVVIALTHVIRAARKTTWLLLSAAMFAAPLAHADNAQRCDGKTLEAVAGWAGIQGELVSWREPDGLIAADACKAMPDAPGTVIAAVAFDVNHDGPGVQNGEKVQIVALVESGKVVAANRSTIQEDALTQIGRYRIDTAPYRLAPDVRAFGVEFSSDANGSNYADARFEHELTLWIREGDRLRAVFGTNLDGWIHLDDKFFAADNTGARTESAHMTIAVEKTSSHGLADLAVTAHVTQTVATEDGTSDTGKRTARTVLKYDGQSYGMDMYRTFWYPDACPVCM